MSAEEIVVPKCDCSKRPEFLDPKQPFHRPGCPRLVALYEKYAPGQEESHAH